MSGFNWEIRRREHWALLGENGAGKSLVAGAISRKLLVGEGEIHYYFNSSPAFATYPQSGEVITIGLEEHHHLIQRTAGYLQARWQSVDAGASPLVRDYLTGLLPAEPSFMEAAHLQKRQELFESVVETTSLQQLLDRRLQMLSNGECRRLLLAAGLMQSPRLLILDDPFAGLDGHSRLRLHKILEQLLCKSSPQIIFISPRMEELPDGITHLLWMENRQIKAAGPKAEILAQYQGSRAADSTDILSNVEFPWKTGEHETSQEPLLEVREATVIYNGNVILDRINWAVRPGEHWALLGHNGAGKTTLLSLFLGDNPQAYANQVFLFGKRRGSGESIWEVKRQIGWVAPELQVYYPRHVTCEEVVISGFFDSVGIFRQPTREQINLAHAWMKAFQLEYLRDHPFNTLSAGQQRLALLARALVKNPRLLLLDEPFQALDAAYRRQLRKSIDQLCHRTTVQLICISHHPEDLPDAITHVLRLERGKVIACGPQEDII